MTGSRECQEFSSSLKSVTCNSFKWEESAKIAVTLESGVT